MFNFFRRSAEQQLKAHETALHSLNEALLDQGLPTYFFLTGGFNSAYRLYPPPRYLGSWVPPFVRLSKIYLVHLPDSPDEKHITFDVGSGGIEVTG